MIDMTEEEYTKEDLEFGERVANQVSLALIAVAKAVVLGNEENWVMPMKHYINMGFTVAETELQIFLDPERRRAVFNLVVDTLEKHRGFSRKGDKRWMSAQEDLENISGRNVGIAEITVKNLQGRC